MKQVILFLSLCSFLTLTTAQNCAANDALAAGTCPLGQKNITLSDCVDLCDNKTTPIPPSKCLDYPHCCGNGTNCFLNIPITTPSGENETDAASELKKKLLGELPTKVEQRNLFLGVPTPGVPFPGCVPNLPSGGLPFTLAFPGYGSGSAANPFGPPAPPNQPLPPPPGATGFYGGTSPFGPSFNPLLPPVGFPPVQLPNTCPHFPNNCKPNCQNPDFSPAVDIPYCNRIPCSPSDPLLDQDFAKCIRQPGCSFDYELFQYRKYLKQGVLAGVPVCHLTIRHPVFHRRAAEYVQQYGSWNPLLTDCLINEYKEEIFGGSPGCYMVSLLEHYGDYAKSCGWSSIRQSECYLVGCCWRNHPKLGPGCVSPVYPNQIQIRSSNNQQEELGLPNQRDLYGLPTCLKMDSNAVGAAFVDNYHTCLKTGCAVNVDINTYYCNLYKAGAGHLPHYLQQSYVDMIKAGTARPDNYKQVIKNILRNDPLSGFTGVPGANTGSIALSLPLNDDSSGETGSSPRLFGQNFGLGFGLPSFCYSRVSAAPQHPTFPNFGPSQPIETSLNLENASPRFGVRPPFSVFGSYQPQCPYRPLNYPGLPPLKGKFDGCCDKPFCYIPKHLVRSQSSGSSTYLSQWSEYDVCSKTCGGGTQKRTRRCIGRFCDNTKDEEQTKVCNQKCCAQYGPWSSWSTCSQSRCGDGVQTRSRECYCDGKLAQGQCEGLEKERKTCSICACPTFQHSHWSICNGDCCNGYRTRTRSCSDRGTCPQAANWCKPKVERESCPLFCDKWVIPTTVTLNTGRCDQTYCVLFLEPVCQTSNGSPGTCCNPDEKGNGRFSQQRCCEGRCRSFCSPSLFAGR